MSGVKVEIGFKSGNTISFRCAKLEVTWDDCGKLTGYKTEGLHGVKPLWISLDSVEYVLQVGVG